MADERVRRRRRSRRRRLVALAAAVVVVSAGAGTAWAMSGSAGTSYRLARVTRANVAQTVDADGTLTSRDTATQSFAAAGTVKSVLVKTGQHVVAGQVLATLDRASLEADVTSARNTLANARQTLADNEAGQSGDSTGTQSGSSGATGSSQTTTGSSTGSTTTGSTVTTDSASVRRGQGSVVLVADETTTNTALTAAEAAVRAAQTNVVEAQSRLDGYVSDLTSACTTSADTETTEKVVANNSGSVSDDVDTDSVVTLADDSTTSENPQTVGSGDSYTFSGLTAGQTYRVVVVPVVDGTACTQAISNVSEAKGAKNDTSSSTLYGALQKLTGAIASLQKSAAAGGSSGAGSSGAGSPTSGSSGTSGTGSGSGTKDGSKTPVATSGGSNPSAAPSGAAPTGSTSSSGTMPAGGRSSTGSTGSTGNSSSTTSGGTSSATSGSSSTTTTVTAAQIAADQKSIDAAKAQLAVARNDMNLATLTTPISGTVASVDITAGSSVSASSDSDTIVVTTDQSLSVPVDVSLADIGLIKVGQIARVTVDGRTASLAAKVSLIGLANVSSSTGSSSEYAVTLVLDRREAKLYDGMGATVAIDVGSARNVITVPVSAVTTTGTSSDVTELSDDKETTTRVTLGVEGTSRVQVTNGLKVGDEVVLANLSEAVPSDSSTDSGSGSLTGGQGQVGGAGSGSFGGQRGGTGGPP